MTPPRSEVIQRRVWCVTQHQHCAWTFWWTPTVPSFVWVWAACSLTSKHLTSHRLILNGYKSLPETRAESPRNPPLKQIPPEFHVRNLNQIALPIGPSCRERDDSQIIWPSRPEPTGSLRFLSTVSHRCRLVNPGSSGEKVNGLQRNSTNLSFTILKS
jgi:hypothetical protein